jgi:ATP-dependent Clp protease ATP-binding subunit ClpA
MFVFEHFTNEARIVVVCAQEEVRLLGNDRIATEHLLLGLLRREDNETGRLLRSAGAGLAETRQLIQASPDRAKVAPGDIPFSPRAKRALEESWRVAQWFGQPYIERPHLPRGLLQVRDSMAVRLLSDLRVDLDALATRADSLGAERHGMPPAAPPGTAAAPGLRTARDVIEALYGWLDVDEPMVEAVGNTIAKYQRVDSQELARRIVGTVITVLEQHLAPGA